MSGIIMAGPHRSLDTDHPHHTEIHAQMLEELGYTNENTLTLDNPVFYGSVAFGNVTMWVDGWFPLHNTYRDTFEGRAEIVGAVAEGGALEGYLVDKPAPMNSASRALRISSATRSRKRSTATAMALPISWRALPAGAAR